MIVGAMARLKPGRDDDVRRRLEHVDGVEVSDVQRPGTVGLIVEARDVDAAHRILTREISAVDGVLAVWPVSAWYDDDGPHSPDPLPGEEHA